MQESQGLTLSCTGVILASDQAHRGTFCELSNFAVSDDKNAARVSFELERDQVLGFVVQLECRYNGEWIPVVRYDTHHGFAHRDILHPFREPTKTEMPVRNYNEGLTYAIQDLRTNWETYRRRYEQWKKK